tara:strand:+ start:810 stop:947 length:138 start_codon:yes stop_codon:yes gene_type:complete
LNKYQNTIDPSFEGKFPNGAWQDKILPQLKKGVISSLLAARDGVL